jgi:hypothetical protein
LKLVHAKVNRLLAEPLLNPELRACLVLSAASLGLVKGDEAVAKEQKFNRILDALISKLPKRKENDHGKEGCEKDVDLQPGPGGHLPELRERVPGAASQGKR